MDIWFLYPALALMAGLLALAPLGAQVLQRGVVFIDLAVAQAAAAAVLWLGAFAHHENPWVMQAMAGAGALGATWGVAWLARRWPEQREALIGLLYVAGAALALLGARLHPHGKDHLMSLLAADVLWADAFQVSLLCACALAVWFLFRGARQRLHQDRYFYVSFALVASVAVPALGLFLVFTCLIAPALWMARGHSVRRALGGALAAGLLGLAASWALDAPSGALMALALALFGVSSLFSSSR